MVLKQIDNLKVILHGELTVNNRPEESDVKMALYRMLDTEHEERSALTNELKKRLDTIKIRQKRKTPPIPELESVKASSEKDLDSTLSHAILAYDVTPAGLETWISSFQAYVSNEKGLDNKAIVAYVRRFLDEEFKISNVFPLISDDLCIEQIMNVLRKDLKTRFDLSSRPMKLFHMERADNEELHQFITRVR